MRKTQVTNKRLKNARKWAFAVLQEIIGRDFTIEKLEKLSKMSDEEFEKLELYPDFDV